MDINVEQLLEKVLESFSEIDYIRTGDIPAIDLYMDQVTTFMDSKLKNTTRNPEEDKILTKTMINNYTKNDLLPPPVKKKYSKEHVLLLIFIYYFKGVLSINDIQTLLGPLTENYFQGNGKFTLEDVYEEVFSLEEGYIELLKQDVIEKYEKAESTFTDAPGKDKKFLQQFAFICMLSFDVYIKKLLIEKLIDGIHEGTVKEADASKSEQKTKETKPVK